MLISNSNKKEPYYQEFSELGTPIHNGSTMSTTVSESIEKLPISGTNDTLPNPGYPRRSRQERRKREYTYDRDFVCGCGKDYLSYGALFTHSRFNHGLVFQKGTKIRIVRLGYQIILTQDQPARSCVASTEFYIGDKSPLDPKQYDPRNTSGTATGIYSAAMLQVNRGTETQIQPQPATVQRLQLPAECFSTSLTVQQQKKPRPTHEITKSDENEILNSQYYYMQAGDN